jgi:hypothetical protein
MVLVHFEITPKALANLSPGFERSENLGIQIQKSNQNLKGLGAWRTLSGFLTKTCLDPKVVAELQPLG